MIQWIIVGIVVVAALILIIKKLTGENSCNCSGCPGESHCKIKEDGKKKK